MRYLGHPPLLLAVLCASGCATYERGTLAAASTTPLALETTVVEENVEGRSCSRLFEQRFNLAVDTALAEAPGANALVDVSSRFERFCIVVRGTAVRVPAAGGH